MNEVSGCPWGCISWSAAIAVYEGSCTTISGLLSHFFFHAREYRKISLSYAVFYLENGKGS